MEVQKIGLSLLCIFPILSDNSFLILPSLFAKSKIEFDERQRKLDEKRDKMIETYNKAGLIQGKVAEETVF